MKIYIATKFENKLLAKSFVYELKNKSNLNINITSSWLNLIDVPNIVKCAKIDYEEIDKSDIVIGLFPFSCGANSELGYAVGKGIKVFYYIDPIFYLDRVKITWGEAKPLISGLLCWPYELEYDFNYNSEMVNFMLKRCNTNQKGYIVHNIKDLIDILGLLYSNIND